MRDNDMTDQRSDTNLADVFALKHLFIIQPLPQFIGIVMINRVDFRSVQQLNNPCRAAFRVFCELG